MRKQVFLIYLLLFSSGLTASLAGTNGWTLIGWNDLGMHCMDGSDYSLFSVLPPFNTFQAQLIYRGDLITNASGLEITYEAMADPDGSFNSTSQDKINFWQYAGQLFGASPAGDVGLAGFAMPGPANLPQAMHFNTDRWVAEGVPITPYDDTTNKNFYPMMRLVARSNGVVLASTDIVLPVSDEMDCRTCHRSGAGDAAKPADGWSWSCGPERDVKLNILRLHDERHAGTTLYSNALVWAGYAPGLYPSVVSNATPVLCAKCHKSNALGTTGYPGIHHFTHAMHGLHANVVDPLTGTSLDAAVNRAACYRCHPGSETKCLRGAMGASIAPDGAMAVNCQQCHGNLAQVAVTNREGWFQEPNCQACHVGTATNTYGTIRFLSAFTASNTWRTASDRTFATASNAPATGLSLYRFSTGHGGLSCEACHGSTHAEFPSIHRNDNVQSEQIQGHRGTLGECAACHTTNPVTINGGPHGMHPVDSSWLSRHKNPGETETQCRGCHGADYRGTVLSRTFGNRTFSTGFGTKQFWKGFQVGCYSCHNGPNSSSPTTNAPALVSSLTTNTVAGQAVNLTLAGTDANGNFLTFRVVSQPPHGAVALSNTTARYFPDPQFVGTDTFTFAAHDGWTDSNLATARVVVTQGGCLLALETTTPLTAPAGVSIPFWALPSVGACSNRMHVQWFFGDGSSGSLTNDCHSYGAAGTYTWKAVVSAGAVAITNEGVITISSPEVDADGDGLPDAWELVHFGSTTNADQTTDQDGDGFIDLHEFLAGTSPTNDQSMLEIVTESSPVQAAGVVIRWASEPGKLYQISRSVDLLSGTFVTVATNLPATPTLNTYTDQSTAVDSAVYRISVSP